MVTQSDAPFRIMCKLHGATMGFTQMLNSSQFVNNPTYSSSVVDWVDYPEDKTGITTGSSYKAADQPLIAQVAGDNIDNLIKCGEKLQDHVTAIDLNLGCPQSIAKRGNYGAYLLPQREKVRSIVEAMVRNIDCPITVKIRKLSKNEETIALCQDLESCGVSMLTVHGRTKEQNKQFVGAADWGIIKHVRNSVSIPVVANGGIGSYGDIQKCIDITGVHGVMSSEAILENPYLFTQGNEFMFARENYIKSQLGVVTEYLELVSAFASREGVSKEYLSYLATCAKGHLFKLLYRMFNTPLLSDLRPTLGSAG
ncbi:unnamed protein product, partial [Ectocarpus fasciculatus]